MIIPNFECNIKSLKFKIAAQHSFYLIFWCFKPLTLDFILYVGNESYFQMNCKPSLHLTVNGFVGMTFDDYLR